ncbi:MAG: efflux RND transporter periplasmic adaptor subunit [Gammaproteobacteria bacterium]
MNKTAIVIAGIALAAGLGGGYWLAQRGAAPVAPGGGQQAAAGKPLYYRHPMNPSVTSPVPAKDDMGMDYVPVYADGDKAADEPVGTVKIDPVTVQNIGVRTARVERRSLSRTLRTVGRVDFDEEHLARLHPKVEGWIEKMRVDKTGEQVKKAQVLLSIYAPQLVSSQEEYLLALQNRKVLENSPFEDIRRGAIELVQSARERLELLDMAEHQIRELEKSGKIKKYVHIHSPFDGVVIKVGVREGQFVTPKTELYSIADLSRVWVYMDVFEDELPWVKVGDEAEMAVAAVPGRTFRGKITYIYPYFESKTRTVKVRMEFDNHHGQLKPEMFADVTIHAGRQINAVVVPEEAIVRSGSRELVFMVRAPGKFEPRIVEVGVSSGGMTQILSGVQPGEEVVTSAQFLIDSESKLREATAKMLESATGGGQKKPADGTMEGMDMPAADGNTGNMDMNMNMNMDHQSGAMPGMVHDAAGHSAEPGMSMPMSGEHGGMQHD